MHFKKLGKWVEFTLPPGWSGITADKIFREKWKAPKKNRSYLSDGEKSDLKRRGDKLESSIACGFKNSGPHV